MYIFITTEILTDKMRLLQKKKLTIINCIKLKTTIKPNTNDSNLM